MKDNKMTAKEYLKSLGFTEGQTKLRIETKDKGFYLVEAMEAYAQHIKTDVSKSTISICSMHFEYNSECRLCNIDSLENQTDVSKESIQEPNQLYYSLGLEAYKRVRSVILESGFDKKLESFDLNTIDTMFSKLSETIRVEFTNETGYTQGSEMANMTYSDWLENKMIEAQHIKTDVSKESIEKVFEDGAQALHETINVNDGSCANPKKYEELKLKSLTDFQTKQVEVTDEELEVLAEKTYENLLDIMPDSDNQYAFEQGYIICGKRMRKQSE